MNPNLNNLIAALGKQHGAERIVLFGSRARGDNTERSDIDLAVFGLPEGMEPVFLQDVDDLPTLLKFDVVFISPYTSTALLAEIKRDGVTLYEAI